MCWKTFDWKSEKVGQRGEVLTRTTYRCGFCKATGRVSNRRCPVCSGTGTAKISPPAVICGYCNGEGSSFLNRDLTCIVCKGIGVVSVNCKDIEICRTCKGRGRERGTDLPCLTCKGIGMLTKNKGY